MVASLPWDMLQERWLPWKVGLYTWEMISLCGCDFWMGKLAYDSLNIFEESYKALLDFRMIIDNDFLKFVSQWPSNIQVFVILTMLQRHFSFLITVFRCFYEILSSLGINELLHFLIAFLNFSWEKRGQDLVGFDRTSLRMLGLIC